MRAAQANRACSGWWRAWSPASAGQSRLEGPDLAAGRVPALGWVPQHPTVLAGTVLDNIALGRPGIDERTARAALEAVQLGSWLRSLPQGLGTPLSGLDASAQPGGAPQAGHGQVPGRTVPATVAA